MCVGRSPKQRARASISGCVLLSWEGYSRRHRWNGLVRRKPDKRLEITQLFQPCKMSHLAVASQFRGKLLKPGNCVCVRVRMRFLCSSLASVQSSSYATSATEADTTPLRGLACKLAERAAAPVLRALLSRPVICEVIVLGSQFHKAYAHIVSDSV